MTDASAPLAATVATREIQTAAARPAPLRATAGPAQATYGALDLGTNNCRLLVAAPSPGGG
ncbi:MAG TPA: hypothetical protein VGM32_24005, partial [Rhodopila sp.]